jgi:hypothetical protein
MGSMPYPEKTECPVPGRSNGETQGRWNFAIAFLTLELAAAQESRTPVRGNFRMRPAGQGRFESLARHQFPTEKPGQHIQ